nr:unnamed protein product [Digitaria exilis]
MTGSQSVLGGGLGRRRRRHLRARRSSRRRRFHRCCITRSWAHTSWRATNTALLEGHHHNSSCWRVRATLHGRQHNASEPPWQPISDLSQTCGSVAAFLIFGNKMAERMAYFVLSVAGRVVSFIVRAESSACRW